MPYLRLYSRDMPIDEKRLIAQKLIEITRRTFNMPPEKPNRITIQFIPRDADFTLEVIAYDLTDAKKRTFAEEAAPILGHLKPVKPRSRVARLLGIKADTPREVAIQFNEPSGEETSMGEPFIEWISQDPAA
jgi:hypothetical protein